jgi:dsDNA-specific endonuclease/ATPase MutS2
MEILSQEAINLQDLALKELEFQTVLDYISKYCYSTQGKEITLALTPTDDLEWLRAEHNFIEEMSRLATEDQTMPFEGLTDVRLLLNKSLIDNRY